MTGNELQKAAAHEKAHEKAQGCGPKNDNAYRDDKASPEDKASPGQGRQRHASEARSPSPPVPAREGKEGKEAGGKEGGTSGSLNNGSSPVDEHKDSARRVASLEDGRPVYLRQTSDGWTVQVPNRSDTYLPPGIEPDDVEADPGLAQTLASLPAPVADHRSGGVVKLGIGRTGPYLLLDAPGGTEYADIPQGDYDSVDPLALLDPDSGSIEERLLERLEGDGAPGPDEWSTDSIYSRRELSYAAGSTSDYFAPENVVE